MSKKIVSSVFFLLFLIRILYADPTGDSIEKGEKDLLQGVKFRGTLSYGFYIALILTGVLLKIIFHR